MSWPIAPSIDHVVHNVDVGATALPFALTRFKGLLTTDRRVTCSIQCPQVAVERISTNAALLIGERYLTANKRSVTVRTFWVKRPVQTFGDDRVLNGHVATVCD